jgi:hypothetical protein
MGSNNHQTNTEPGAVATSACVVRWSSITTEYPSGYPSGASGEWHDSTVTIPNDPNDREAKLARIRRLHEDVQRRLEEIRDLEGQQGESPVVPPEPDGTGTPPSEHASKSNATPRSKAAMWSAIAAIASLLTAVLALIFGILKEGGDSGGQQSSEVTGTITSTVTGTVTVSVVGTLPVTVTVFATDPPLPLPKSGP